MRFLFRWIANAVAFYLALYLVDSLMAPRFCVEAVWVAVILAVSWVCSTASSGRCT